MTGRQLLDFRAGAPWSERASEVFRRAADAAWADPIHPSSEGRRAATWLDAARATVSELTGYRHVAFMGNRDHAVAACIGGFDGPSAAAATHRSAVLNLVDVQVPVNADGTASWEQVLPGTLIVLQAANEETGVADSVPAGHPLVLDATQAFGRLPIASDADIVIADARAWGSPIDTTLLLAQRPLAVIEDVQVPAAVVAVDMLTEVWPLMPSRAERERRAMEALERVIVAELPDVQFHGVHPVGHVRSLSVLHLDAETLMRALDAQGWVVGSGSACVQDGTPSHVLAAMGRVTHGNLRLALPVDADLDALDDFARAVIDTSSLLRREAGVEDL